MFDTHQFVKDMTGAKMPKAQAEMLGKALLDSRTNTATKGDIAGAKELTGEKFASVKAQFDSVDTRFENLQDRMDIMFNAAVNSVVLRLIFAYIAFSSVILTAAGVFISLSQ